ncbi:putative B3 domain-containing protein [Trifolium repens]|nr:putative B3 domain-containing protein [Trifolium repens]
MNQSSKMKEKVYDFYPTDFNSDEREVASILLQWPKLHIAQVMEKRRKLKITLGGKRISKIREETYNDSNVHPVPQINIPDVVKENLNNPLDIPMIPGVPNNNIPDVVMENVNNPPLDIPTIPGVPNNNIPDVVMENVNNPPLDIPTIPGVPNNNILQCCKPFVKKLSKSDLKVDQNRLFMNKAHVEKYFIPLLRKGEEKIVDGINVIAYDMQGRPFNMKFILWSEKFYVLNGSGWRNFFEKHSLQANQDHVKVWMFRHSETDNICFALSIIRE